MNVRDRLDVLRLNVAQKASACRLLVPSEAFDFVEHYLPFRVAGYHREQLLALDSFDIHAVGWVLLQLFHGKRFHLLLISTIEKADRAVTRAYRYDVLESRDAIWYSLGHLGIAMEPVCDLVVFLEVHQAPLSIVLLLWLLNAVQLARLLDHLLGDDLEAPLVLVNDLEHVVLEFVLLADEGQVIAAVNCILQFLRPRVNRLVGKVADRGVAQSACLLDAASSALILTLRITLTSVIIVVIGLFLIGVLQLH